MLSDEQTAFLDALAGDWADALTDYAWRFLAYQPHRLADAQDAVQDVFVKAVRYAPKLAAHPNPVAWLKAALKHTLISRYRAEKRRPEVLAADVSQLPGASRDATLAALDRWGEQTRLEDVLAVARDVLTANEQQTFRDHFLLGLTSEESALLEEISPEAVRGRIVRIRKKIRGQFGLSVLFAMLAALYQVRG